MAPLALDFAVYTLAQKIRVQVVIELRRATGGFVAFPAIIPEPGDVNVVLLVTGLASKRFELELSLGVTFRAGNE